MKQYSGYYGFKNENDLLKSKIYEILSTGPLNQICQIHNSHHWRIQHHHTL